MVLNENIPYFKCLIRRSHYTHNTKDSNIYDPVYAFGLQSVPGKILTFHALSDFGMLRSRVPISELFLTEPKKDVPFYYKQLFVGKPATGIDKLHHRQKELQQAFSMLRSPNHDCRSGSP